MIEFDRPLLLRAAARQRVERTPVWFMRQAGRVLPEYRAIRDQLTLLEICQRPDVCTEVTLQPVRRFGMDAAILFADIMHVLVGMNVPLEIKEGVGPVIHQSVRTAADVQRLEPFDAAGRLSFVFDSIRLIKKELDGRTPLIGFAGAPFTLASYLIEGRPTRDFLRTKALMYGEPDVWHAVMQRLSDAVIAFLEAQIDAGADAVQLFDSWVGCLSPDDYARHVRPYTRRIFTAIAPKRVPTIHFGVNTATLLEQIRDDGASVIGADWRIPLDHAWRRIGYGRAIQGNLDPAVLMAPHPVIRSAVQDVLARAEGRPGHIFNLGHGLHPQTPVDAVSFVVDCVRELSSVGVPAREPLFAGTST